MDYEDYLDRMDLAQFDDDYSEDDDQTEFDDGVNEYDDGFTDVEADADTLRSAGWGTDEDYGYFDSYEPGEYGNE